MSPSPAQLPALTTLRFPAALAIVLLHVWGLLLGPGGAIPPLAIWHLWAGLSFFFVLSGFILTHVYLNDLRNPTRRTSWNYLVARWARIYPVHLLTFLIVFPLDYSKLVRGDFGNPVICVATYLGLGHGWLPMTMNKAHAFNTPSWSLSAEMFFYLMLPLLIPALTRGPVWRRAAVGGLALVPWGLAMADMFGAKLLGPITPFRYPPVRILDFLSGVLLALWWHRGRTGASAARSVARATVVEIAAVLLTIAWMWVLVLKVGDVKHLKWLMASGWCGMYLPPFLLLIGVMARGGGLVARVFAWRPLTYLGDVSFALYMLHQPVLSYLYFKGHLIGARAWPWWVQWTAVFGVSMVLSVACYHLYEVPLRDRLRRALSFRKPEAEVPAEVPVRRAA